MFSDFQDEVPLVRPTKKITKANFYKLSPKDYGLNIARWLLDHSTYYRLHLLYFVLWSLFGGLIFYASEDIPYIDALFTAVSALTVTGLTTVDFALFKFGSQFFVLLLMCIGGQVLMTLPLVKKKE